MNATRPAPCDYRAVFEAVTHDPRYLRNIEWGEPRPGHPEGPVRAHLAELDANVELLRARLVGPDDYWKLRVLVHTHDTFKGEAADGAAIRDPHSHASLARAFLATFCGDADLLAMTQFHDEPYSLWRQFHHRGHWDHRRFDALLETIRDWDVFLAFLIVDGSTGGKGREPLRWFLGQVAGQVAARWTAADIL